MTALKKRHLKGASINIRCLKMSETYLKKKRLWNQYYFFIVGSLDSKILRNTRILSIALKYFFKTPEASLEKAIAM